MIKLLDRSSHILDGCCLWVIHANKVPPHIGLSFENQYYSLKSNGVDLGISPESLFKVIDARAISTLVFELKVDNIKTPISVFDSYQSTVPGEITCLHPIKKVLNVPTADKLHHLLSELDEKGAIEAVFGLHLESGFKGIPDYEVTDIHQRLNKLDESKRR